MTTTSEVPAFVIKELGGMRRTLTLRGRGLPMRPLTLEGEQRVKVSNAPGNPIGWATVMGPTEGETKINGYWKDKYIGISDGLEAKSIYLTSEPTADSPGSGAALTTASEAIANLDSMRSSGSLLEVSWGFIVRRGYIKKLEQKWHNIHDVEWDLTFAWVAKDFGPPPAAYGPRAGQLEAANGLRALLRQLARALDAPNQLVGGFMENVRNTLNRVGEFSRVLDESVLNFQDSLMGPSELAGRVQQMLGSAVSVLNDFKETGESAGWVELFTDPISLVPFSGGAPTEVLLGTSMEDPSVEASSLEADAITSGLESIDPVTGEVVMSAEEAAIFAVLDSINPEKVLQMQLYARETIDDATQFRNAVQAMMRARTATPGTVITTYTAREGDDLRDVSLRFYGTPYQWRYLMIYNNFPNSELYPGQRVVIPRLERELEADQ